MQRERERESGKKWNILELKILLLLKSGKGKRMVLLKWSGSSPFQSGFECVADKVCVRERECVCVFQFVRFSVCVRLGQSISASTVCKCCCISDSLYLSRSLSALTLAQQTAKHDGQTMANTISSQWKCFLLLFLPLLFFFFAWRLSLSSSSANVMQSELWQLAFALQLSAHTHIHSLLFTERALLCIAFFCFLPLKPLSNGDIDIETAAPAAAAAAVSIDVQPFSTKLLAAAVARALQHIAAANSLIHFETHTLTLTQFVVICASIALRIVCRHPKS